MKVGQLKTLLELYDNKLDVVLSVLGSDHVFTEDAFEIAAVDGCPANGIFGPLVFLKIGKGINY